jgi:hypothetical protein
MEAIKVGNQNRRSENEQHHMSKYKIRAPQGQFDNFDDELSRGLRHHMRAQAAVSPSTCPPCSVGFIMLEFTGKEDRNQDLVNSPLDRDDGNKTKNNTRRVPFFQVPLRSKKQDSISHHHLHVVIYERNDLRGTRRTQSCPKFQAYGQRKP